MTVWFPETEEKKQLLMQWAMRGLGMQTITEPAYPVGIFVDDQIACVAVYHDFRPPSVIMSLYAINPKWASKKAIQTLYSFAFTAKPAGLGAGRITALIEKKNKRSRRFVEGIGFKLEGCVRKGGALGADDMMIYGLLRRELEVRGKNISVEGNIPQLRKWMNGQTRRTAASRP